MKTATLSIIENAFVGTHPHEATFTFLNLDDGTTAPLGKIKIIAVSSRNDAEEWAKGNGIHIVKQ